MNLITREAQTQGWNLAIQNLTGEWPDIDRQPEFNTITLSENQILHGQKFFLDILESEPGEVRFSNMGKVINPVLIKKYWPYAAALAITGALIGAILKR